MRPRSGRDGSVGILQALELVSRPTNARRSPPTPRGRISESARTSRRQGRRPAFPSPRPSPARRARRRRAPRHGALADQDLAGRAACSSRAPTLTASPVTNELPSRGRPTTTSPVLTPMRSASPVAEQLAQPLLHRERRVQRALGVVLLRGRGAERGHHGVADELLDRAAGALDLRRPSPRRSGRATRACARDPARRRARSSRPGRRRGQSRACAPRCAARRRQPQRTSGRTCALSGSPAPH